MYNAAFITSGGRPAINNAYQQATREYLASRLCFPAEVLSEEALAEQRGELSGVEYLFSTWGMPELSETQIADSFPSLKAVFYAAGSVQAFARPFLARGVRIFSAWAANAVPVAEYTAAQIILAGKGFFQASRLYQSQGFDAAHAHSAAHRGNYGAKVGVIGAGMIGRMVIERLKSVRLPVLVFDPFLSEEQAAGLGVEKRELPDLFSECQVVSNHLANNPQTVGMLDYRCFSRMGPYAAFLNTGRGAQVVEADLIRALREEPGRTAVLDVTWPEPAEPESPLLTMRNVILTPHIAGSMGDEIARMGQYMAEEFSALAEGRAPRWEVTGDMLAHMA